MDLLDDEPRKQPQPVPFCQASILQPSVPDVSLILGDVFNDNSDKKNDPFSGTEFQTYNAWRWKHFSMKEQSEKLSQPRNCPKSSPDIVNKCTDMKKCCVFKDKYASSDVEQRKNEILYGQSDEPRRPLPPRVSPVIPKCTDNFFSPVSFDDFKWNDDDDMVDKNQKVLPSLNKPVKVDTVNNFNMGDLKIESDTYDKLYKIIADHNKQIEVLQKQIEQLLKLQDVKDKQIEQLLKSQETKEVKMQQYLQSLSSKDREVEKLLKLKDKQEQQLKEFIRSQDVKNKENLELIRKLEDLQRKNVRSVGVNTRVQISEASTNTDLEYCTKECCTKKSENNVEEEISCIRGINESNGFDTRDKSLSLHSIDLPVIQEHVPTPQSSIHVDIQDFHDSADDSDSDSDTLGNNCPSTQTQSSPLGYTFYNNVLTQVNDIIQKSGEKENIQIDGKRENGQLVMNTPMGEYNYIRQKKGAVQSFQAWGVNVFERERMPPSLEEEQENQDPTERLQYDPQNLYVKETCSPSDISLKINALAMKYLKQEQISQYELQTQKGTSNQPDVTIYNVTNLSFGSMRYLDRYRILPNQQQTTNQNFTKPECSPTQMLRRKKKIAVQETLNPSMGNILDMSTLNQQPKLF